MSSIDARINGFGRIELTFIRRGESSTMGGRKEVANDMHASPSR